MFQVICMFIMSFPKATTHQDIKHDLLGCKETRKTKSKTTTPEQVLKRSLIWSVFFPPGRARGKGQAQIRVWSIPTQPYFFQTLRPLQVFSNDAQEKTVTHFRRRVACSSTFQAWRTCHANRLYCWGNTETWRARKRFFILCDTQTSGWRQVGTDCGTRRAVTASLADDGWLNPACRCAGFSQ